MITIRTPARWLAVATVTLALAVSQFGMANATEYPKGYRFSQSVDLAGANWTTIDDAVFADLTISVYDVTETSGANPGMNRYDSGVTIFFDRWTTDAESLVTTHVTYTTFDGIQGGFDFDRSLAGASAGFSTVLTDGTLCRYTGNGGPPDGITPGEAFDGEEPEDECELLPDLPVTIDLEWIGDGDIDRDTSRFASADSPLARFFAHQVIAVRGASVAGGMRIETAELPAEVVFPEGPADVGVLLRGKSNEHLVIAH
jgi:hypothetical protein